MQPRKILFLEQTDVKKKKNPNSKFITDDRSHYTLLRLTCYHPGNLRRYRIAKNLAI